jgi:hypothetical protein
MSPPTQHERRDAMQGNSGFLRRQEPISPAIEWLHDGSLPSQGSGEEENLLFQQGDVCC